MVVQIIKQSQSSYELQHKPSLESRVVTFAERFSDPAVLKNSLSLEWQESDTDNVLWVAQYDNYN
ncbi:hypothetical protein [Cytobacillus praedii]|uniref:Uncharacterized protein n=1 Tax=Cytobacillus praedii TaxID=1742358 RepID=A0A4R1AVF5_9BACI|nr:hypothetical protein [Cytobacillus praedii]TCJ00963.1 hypothetical protein E0Y62_26400 [Cytobacillus praedii]